MAYYQNRLICCACSAVAGIMLLLLSSYVMGYMHVRLEQKGKNSTSAGDQGNDSSLGPLDSKLAEAILILMIPVVVTGGALVVLAVQYGLKMTVRSSLLRYRMREVQQRRILQGLVTQVDMNNPHGQPAMPPVPPMYSIDPAGSFYHQQCPHTGDDNTCVQADHGYMGMDPPPYSLVLSAGEDDEQMPATGTMEDMMDEPTNGITDLIQDVCIIEDMENEKAENV